jgi:hypothetical protein
MGYLLKNKAKSKNLLYPLLEIPKSNIIQDNNYHTYLRWSETDESIDDYLFIVLYKNLDFSNKEYQSYINNNILKNKNLSNCYFTSKGEVYIFNFFDRRETIDLFLSGKYSKFNEEEKKIILKYHKQNNIKKPCLLVNNFPELPHHVILYPEYYYDLVAKELYEEMDLETGIEYIKKCGELWEKYDYELEFLECDIVSTCQNYDKLTLNFSGT